MYKKIINNVEYALRLFKHLYLKPENEIRWLKSLNKKFDVAIDAGANRGYISHILSHKSNDVIAIEPIDYLAEYLSNVLPKNCKVLNKAASSDNGERNIKIPIDKNGKDISALSSIENQNNFIDSLEVETFREVKIDTMTIDSYVHKRLSSIRKIDFIKIDVEGHEQALLEGAKNTIIKHCPIVLIEMEQRHGSSIDKIYDFFKKNNYSSYYVKQGELSSCNLEFFIQAQTKNKIDDPNYISDLIFAKTDTIL